MATRAPRKTRTERVAPASPQVSEPDPLREAAQLPRNQDIIQWQVLAGVFVLVWILVVGLMFPGFPNEFRFFMARRHQARQRPAAAAKYLERLLKDMPANPTVSGELGYSYFQIGKYDEAIKHYEVAQANVANVKPNDQGKMPQISDFNAEIGSAYYRKGDVQNAEKYLLLGLEFDKFDKEANFLMGEILVKRGEYRKAADYFKVVANVPAYSDRVQKHYAEIEAKLFADLK